MKYLIALCVLTAACAAPADVADVDAGQNNGGDAAAAEDDDGGTTYGHTNEWSPAWFLGHVDPALRADAGAVAQ
jgi:opacity protein-like surface antigen